MPGSPRSLLVTDTYRARLLELQQRVEAFTRQRWSSVGLVDLDGSHDAWLSVTVVALEQAQRGGVRLTAAYLAAFVASEMGRSRLELPAVREDGFVGVAQDGRGLGETLAATLITVKTALKDGKPPEDALREGGERAARLAASATLSAPRAVMQDQIETHPMIVGWRRVTSGGCGACLAAAAHPYAREPMRVHDHCHCSQEPIVRDVPDRAARATGPELFHRMSTAEQDAALGPDAAQLVRQGAIAWPDLIAVSPMKVGADQITQAPVAALAA